MKKIFTVKILQKNEIHIKDTCVGNIFVMPTCGGTFESTMCNGSVEPVGAIISTCSGPGINDLKGSIVLKTDNDEHVILNMDAYLNIPPEAEEALANKEEVSHEREDVYSKGTVNIQTGSELFKFLERKVFICEIHLDGWETFVIEVYEPN